jgi:hypothetical protein
MDWYWNLSTILFENQPIADELQAELEKHVVSLYKKLLSYQMKSVCSFSRMRAAVVWRDMFRFDDWTDAVQSVKDAETVVQRDIDSYNSLVTRTTLSSMAELAKDRNIQLQDINQAIQKSAQIMEERQQDGQNRKCLEDLRLSDPRVDRRRIEVTKGGLFRGASNWILDHNDFQRWYHCDDIRLLWVKGDPGKGKTMLLFTILEKLEQQLAPPEQQQSSRNCVLSYFFCQGTNKDLNTATSVLRGLIYLLAVQNPTLIPHLRESYDHAGPDLFEDANSFFALSKVLESMLLDKSVTRAYIVVDALDECMTDREMLLKLIVDCAAASPHLKWIMSSRNRPEIEQHLKLDHSSMKLSLELTQNADQVSQAVDAYIDFKISGFQSLQSDHEQRNRVRAILREKANGTFLWVALVANRLEKARGWRVLRVVEEVPAGLDELYGVMMQQIRQQEEDWELCQRVLSAATLAYRPLHLAELAVLSGLPKEIIANMEYVRQVVALCGSFLTIQDDNFAYIIHQSAKEYLSDRATAAVFPSGHADIHCGMLLRSLQAMQERLKRDIYGIHHPGITIDSLRVPDPDPLAAIRYSCVHWADHLCDGYGSSYPKDQVDIHGEPVLRFLQQSSLYWLEALALIQHLGDGVLAMIRLENLLKVSLHSALQ